MLRESREAAPARCGGSHAWLRRDIGGSPHGPWLQKKTAGKPRPYGRDWDALAGPRYFLREIGM